MCSVNAFSENQNETVEKRSGEWREEGPGVSKRIGFEHPNGQSLEKYVIVMLTYAMTLHSEWNKLPKEMIWGCRKNNPVLGMPLIQSISLSFLYHLLYYNFDDFSFFHKKDRLHTQWFFML